MAEERLRHDQLGRARAFSGRDLRYVPWLLPQRGALHVRGGRELGARDAQPSRVFLLRGAWRRLCDGVPRVRDALLLCDGARLLSLT